MNVRTPSLRQTLLSAASLALAGCGAGEGASLRFSVIETPTHAHTSALVQAAAESIAPPTFGSSDGLVFTLTEARIHLKHIRLDLPQDTKCEDVRGLLSGATCKGGETGSGSGTVELPGPLVVDLMTGTTTPDLSGLRLPAGTYRRIDFRLDEGRGDELPAGEPLVGYSLRVKAGFSLDSTPSTLELNLKFSEDARIESSTGVQVGENDALLALLRPHVWLEGLPVASCLRKGDLQMTDDVLRIDERAGGECSGAEELVKTNIKRSGDLRKVD